jgi:hypothetical protein
MSAFESIVVAVERATEAFLAALPFETRLVLTSLLGFLTFAFAVAFAFVRPARPAPLQVAFVRRGDVRGIPAGSNASDPAIAEARNRASCPTAEALKR